MEKAYRTDILLSGGESTQTIVMQSGAGTHRPPRAHRRVEAWARDGYHVLSS